MLPIPGYLFPPSGLEVFSNNFSHISNIFLTLLSFWDIYHINVGRHDIIPKILKPFSFFFFFTILIG